MNMQSLMAQAQKMQRDVLAKKEEINKQEFIGKTDLVEIIVMGDKKIKKVKFSENIALDDMEVVEDMVAIAYNSALIEIEKATEKAMGQYGSLGGLI